MTQTVGRRELNKRATRQALEQAAKQLFAERGFAATTVRDIADAAGVTERTFFRYFAGKEELILDDVLAWLPVLQNAILARPADEAPLVAVVRATAALLRVPRTGTGTSPLLLFTDGRPVGRVGASAPAFMLRVEEGLAAALRERVGSGAEQLARAELAARIALAMFRSVMIEASRGGTNLEEQRDAIAGRLEDALLMVRTDL